MIPPDSADGNRHEQTPQPAKDRSPSDTHEELLRRAEQFIEDRLWDCELSPTQIAEHLSVSTRTLNRIFLVESETVGGWIRARRLERARADLNDPALAARTIGWIAARSGICDPAHFSRLFRERYGMRPTDCRPPAPRPHSPPFDGRGDEEIEMARRS